MTILFALIALGVVVATALRLVQTIRSDGYGLRPAPRSHGYEAYDGCGPPGLSRR